MDEREGEREGGRERERERERESERESCDSREGLERGSAGGWRQSEPRASTRQPPPSLAQGPFSSPHAFQMTGSQCGWLAALRRRVKARPPCSRTRPAAGFPRLARAALCAELRAPPLFALKHARKHAHALARTQFRTHEPTNPRTQTSATLQHTHIRRTRRPRQVRRQSRSGSHACARAGCSRFAGNAEVDMQIRAPAGCAHHTPACPSTHSSRDSHSGSPIGVDSNSTPKLSRIS